VFEFFLQSFEVGEVVLSIKFLGVLADGIVDEPEGYFKWERLWMLLEVSNVVNEHEIF